MNQFNVINRKVKAVAQKVIGAGLASIHFGVFAQATGNSGSISAFDTARQTAGNRTIDTMASNTDRLAGNLYNTMTTGATLLGVLLVGISLWGFYKASKEERETPKPAVVGLIIGGLLTAIGLVAAFSANTLTL